MYETRFLRVHVASEKKTIIVQLGEKSQVVFNFFIDCLFYQLKVKRARCPFGL